MLFILQFKGRIDFEFRRQDIMEEVRRKWPSADNLIGFECVFNVSAKDWFFNMTQKGFASTVIFNPNVRIMFIGDNVRTFKPDSIMTVYVSCVFLCLLLFFLSNFFFSYNDIKIEKFGNCLSILS